MSQQPRHSRYDIVIIGGGIMGASVAFWCARSPDFQGRILVVERDPSYENASTSHTNSCIRQQFGTSVNVQASQFGAEFIHNFQEFMGDPSVPDIALHPFGYLYLAANTAQDAVLRRNQALQANLGAQTKMLTPEDLASRFPYMQFDDIVSGSFNTKDEGYFDSGTVFDQLRRQSRKLGVEFVAAQAVGLECRGQKITAVTLADGSQISAGQVVNAAGPRAAQIAAMAGLSLPVEPRKRYTYIFEAETPLSATMPLTVDPSGVHFRQDGRYFMTGCAPDHDVAVSPDDFIQDHDLWLEKVWPALAARIPAFERIKLRQSWAGHYAYNTFDQNALIGPHSDLTNLFFINGFSGHGIQHAPAMGRGVAELMLTGGFQTLDLSPLLIDRLLSNTPLIEPAII